MTFVIDAYHAIISVITVATNVNSPQQQFSLQIFNTSVKFLTENSTYRNIFNTGLQDNTAWVGVLFEYLTLILVFVSICNVKGQSKV